MEIAILGAGVAGVSSAIALTQQGFNIRIYERHATASNIGAGIVVWPNAAYVLEQLGVLNEVAAVSGYPTRMHRRSRSNEDLGAIDIESINGHMGYPSLSILRNDFQNILVSKLESLGVAIQYTHSVTSIETKGLGQAQVHFQNGLRITADVLVGADGRMASYARRYVHDDNAPVYQGFINWIGVYESEAGSFDEIAVMDYWGVGERFGIVPVTRHKAYWAGGVACSDIGPRNPAEYKDELVSAFSDWPQPIQVFARGATLRFTKGKEHLKEYRQHSGHGGIRAFCSHCGSRLMNYLPDKEIYLSVALSSIDSGFDGKPVAHAFVGSKASWHQPSDDIPSFEAVPAGALDA